MDESKRQRLEAAGWKVGDTSEFLQLSPEESTFIELKLSLTRRLRELRLQNNLTQKKLAEKIESNELNIIQIESGDPSASLDLMVRAMLFLGATKQDIAVSILGNNEKI